MKQEDFDKIETNLARLSDEDVLPLLEVLPDNVHIWTYD